jgi:GNAT superfamily N-acetyltransferase
MPDATMLAMFSRDELLARMARSLQAWQRALGNAAANGAVLEAGPLVGSVVPAAPSRSILNAAGATAWGLWLHEDDASASAAARGAGLSLDSHPTAMALSLDAVAPIERRSELTVQRTDDLGLLAEPLSAGYGFPAGLLTAGLPRLLEHCCGWIARVDGRPAAGALTVAHDGDAGVFLVATAPDLRGRGAATALMQEALRHAREQGCETSTLQASRMGEPLYARLGYVGLGAYLLWEQRDTPPAASGRSQVGPSS